MDGGQVLKQAGVSESRPAPGGERLPHPRAAGHPLRRRAVPLLVASLGLAGAGQFWFANRKEYLVDGVILYLTGVAIFALLVRAMEAPAPAEARRTASLWQLLRAHGWHLGLTALGLGLAAVASRSAAVNPPPTSFTTAITMWLAGCALVVGAQLPAVATWRGLPGRARDWFLAHRSETLAVAAWVVVAAALRLWQLGEAPFPFSGDEASFGLEARRVLTGELRNPFATGWLSHPNMWAFWEAPFLAAFGADVFAVRLLPALIGASTVVAVYLLGREMYGAVVGHIAAAILAAYPYHVHFSRQSLNNISDPWLAAWAFFLLYRGLHRQERFTLALGGAALGLMQYGYLGARVALVIAAAYVLFLLLFERRFVAPQIGGLAVFAVAALAVALPIAWWYGLHFQDFTARLSIVGVLQSGWLDAESAKTGRSALSLMWDQVQRTFLAFNLYPDTTPHYRSPGPLLGFWPSLFFAFGGAYAALRWRDRRAALLLLWVVLALVFGGVLTLTPPNSPRLVVTIPAVVILVAVGLQRVVSLLATSFALPGRVAYATLAGATGLIMLLDVAFYFGEYVPKPYYSDTNTEIADLAGQYLARLDGKYEVYFMGAPRMFVAFPTLVYRAGSAYTRGKDVGVDIEKPLPPRQRPAMVQGEHRLVFIVLPERAKELETVQEFFPGGALERFKGRSANDLFTIYRVD